MRQGAVSRAPVGLDADTIVTSALTLIDEHGVGAFTIRSLAQRLGVQAPTIYWHVGSKTELLEAVVERVVLVPAPPVPDDRSWDDRLRQFFDTVLDRLVAHPNVLELMQSVHSRAFQHWITTAYDIVRHAGFPEEQAATFARLAVAHAVSCAQFEANTRTAEYIEPVPGDRSGRKYRVKPTMLGADLPAELALATSYDVEEHTALMHTIFIDGLRVQLAR